MGKIPFDHANCNGWAIYEGKYIVGGNADNMHVAECSIQFDGAGNKQVVPNSAKETICKRHLVDYGRHYSFASTDASEMRLKLATLQNNGSEVCGTCVSRFYADPEHS